MHPAHAGNDTTELLTGAAGEGAGPPADGPEPGERIAHYRLLTRLGEGGMGVVYGAEQLEPVQRRVALKLIRRQLEGSLAEAYFEVERQALAAMDHPTIARIHEAGRTAEGWPWFAMEWVDGQRLDEWLHSTQPTLPVRLRLLINVARGVQHAHQRGIIHRDLKPSNILVAIVDGAPQPRIIDFGVAIGLGQPQGAAPASYEIAGTGRYMSGEQATGRAPVDVRTDVHALGMILLDLLLPTDPATRAALESCERGALAAEIAAIARGARPALTACDALAAAPYDLRHILARATAPDRDARYPSVEAFANDLERHLEHRPVTAAPQTLVYRARRFARRHRLPLTATAAVGAALLVGFALAIAGFNRAANEALKARTVAAFLGDLLAGVDPDRAREMDRTLLRLVLDEAAQRARRDLSANPDVLFEVERVIGTSYAALGDHARAVEFLRTAESRALAEAGPGAPVALAIGEQLVGALTEAGSYDEALARSTALLADSRARLGADAPQTLRLLAAHAYVLRELGRYAQAEPLLAQASAGLLIALGPEHRDGVDARYRHAIVLSDLGRFDEARTILQELIALRGARDGAGHPFVLRLRNSLAVSFLQSREFERGAEVLEAALPDYERTFGPDHIATLTIVANLAGALRQAGRVAESGPHYARAAEGMRAALGERHPRAIMTRANYGNYLRDSGRADEAHAMQAALLPLAREVLGDDNPTTLDLQVNLARASIVLGRPREAETWVRAALPALERVYPEGHRRRVEAAEVLAQAQAERQAPPR